jgi:hypothetical protein
MRQPTVRRLLLIVVIVALILAGWSEDSSCGVRSRRYGWCRRLPKGPSIVVAGFKATDDGAISFWLGDRTWLVW